MKRCPTCQRTFIDETQKFCPSDGTPLTNDERPAFDPEATVMGSASQLTGEAPSPSPPAAPPAYYNPASGSQPEPGLPSSAQPAPGGPPAAAWPPPPQGQQPYYPQPGAPAGQPAPQWSGGPPPPQGWAPGQPPPPQGQWGGAPGGYYPQPGQFAQPAKKGLGLSLVALIIGIISFIMFVLVFGMFQRIVPPDRDVAEISIYGTFAAGCLAVLLGLVTLISSRWRKGMGIVGLLISIPGIVFFIYIATQYGLR